MLIPSGPHVWKNEMSSRQTERDANHPKILTSDVSKFRGVSRAGFVNVAACLPLLLAGCWAKPAAAGGPLETLIAQVLDAYGYDASCCLAFQSKLAFERNAFDLFPIASLSKVFLLAAIVCGHPKLGSLRQRRFVLEDVGWDPSCGQ